MILQNIIKDKYLRVVFALSFAVFIFNFIFSFSELAGIGDRIIIHFDAFRGIDFFGSARDVFGILLVALSMVAVNLFLADYLYHRERFLSFILSFVSLTITILILIAVSVIISVN